ncbi:hypothetical protein C9F11_18565 [Streptomyces sp. YIM 121038]|nr:hypothetical protein C9F11_18565 [Streptomyces sp. YIM 121038]
MDAAADTPGSGENERGEDRPWGEHHPAALTGAAASPCAEGGTL